MCCRDPNKLRSQTKKNHSEGVTREVGGDWIMDRLECLAEGLTYHKERGR